jgi:hypothetical protein
MAAALETAQMATRLPLEVARRAVPPFHAVSNVIPDSSYRSDLRHGRIVPARRSGEKCWVGRRHEQIANTR